MKKPTAGNVKPIMQRVQGDTLTEWRIDKDQDRIVREQVTLMVPSSGPNAGTFFLGGMQTTRDELADYLLEANEVNETRVKPDRIPIIQKKIEDARERHAQAITNAVEWKKKGYRLPKQTSQQRRALLLPTAVAKEMPNGALQIVGVRNG